MDDTIDFSKLQKELSNAVAADAKYQRENDAKFRAIAQKVATYDEFRDIVLASNLQPLSKEDKIGGHIYQQWNVSANTNKNKDDNHDKVVKKKLNLPKTEAEFNRDWKHRMNSNEERYDYIVTIVGAKLLSELLKTECELAEVTHVLNSCFNEQDRSSVAEILKILSRTKRFRLLLDFMEPSEKNEIKDLANKLVESGEENMGEIKSLYQL